MKIITVRALKGGVGKTNFVFNLSCFLAIEKKKRILFIDLDPQINLTQCFRLSIDNPWAMQLFENHNHKINDIEMSELEIKLYSQFGREQKLKKHQIINI